MIVQNIHYSSTQESGLGQRWRICAKRAAAGVSWFAGGVAQTGVIAASGEKAAGNIALTLFQRIRQRLDAQATGIIAYAKHAVRLHIVIHHHLYQQATVVQLHGR